MTSCSRSLNRSSSLKGPISDFIDEIKKRMLEVHALRADIKKVQSLLKEYVKIERQWFEEIKNEIEMIVKVPKKFTTFKNDYFSLVDMFIKEFEKIQDCFRDGRKYYLEAQAASKIVQTAVSSFDFKRCDLYTPVHLELFKKVIETGTETCKSNLDQMLAFYNQTKIKLEKKNETLQKYKKLFNEQVQLCCKHTPQTPKTAAGVKKQFVRQLMDQRLPA